MNNTKYFFIILLFFWTFILIKVKTNEVISKLKPSQCDSLSNWKSERLIIYMEVTDMQSEIINNHKSSKEEMENDTALLNTIQKLY